MVRGCLLGLGLGLAACGGHDVGGGGTSAVSGSTAASSVATTHTASSGASGSTGTGAPTTYAPALQAMDFVCKVVSAATIDAPTENHLQTRFNLRGTDLGIPVIVGNELLLFFGDSVGYRAIWDFGEDPDSVARIDAGLVRADPASVCRALDVFVTPDVPSVAASVDPSILRDFAGASMTPPPGEAISDYIAQPAGPFPNLPGTFEVPAGAIADGLGGVYLFYAGRVETTPRTRATLGYLAHWASPTTTGPDYRIVRRVDSLDGRELGGHFVQVAPLRVGSTTYLYGTGDYRRSGVYLARLAAVEDGGEELFDPTANAFVPAEALDVDARSAIPPLFEEEGVGEVSVVRLDEVGVVVAVYQRELHDVGGNIVDNRIVLRTASAPEGPFSDAVTLVDMADPVFRAARCCGASCSAEQILHCDRAGLYGAYALPTATAAVGAGGTVRLTVPMLVSTWDPYNVVLFTAAVDLTPTPAP